MSLALIELFSTELTGRLTSWLNVAVVDYTSNLFNNVYLYGVFFYNNWYIPFLIAAVVLLVAMIGSIVLTTRLVVVSSTITKRNFSVLGFVVGLIAVTVLV
jgi:NADH:ubiquinone oxidoreductase subunit 6 (subunit J)